MQATSGQTLAQAANTSNKNALAADRPWMGAYLTVTDFAVGKTPTYTVTFINSGKRPARTTLTQTLAVPYNFGADPIYTPYDTTPSTTFAVPGQGVVASWKDNDKLNPISDDLMKAVESGAVPFRVYAKIEYTDSQTHARYWTHVCWRYIPLPSAASGRFSNCTEYNEAK